MPSERQRIFFPIRKLHANSAEIRAEIASADATSPQNTYENHGRPSSRRRVRRRLSALSLCLYVCMIWVSPASATALLALPAPPGRNQYVIVTTTDCHTTTGCAHHVEPVVLPRGGQDFGHAARLDDWHPLSKRKSLKGKPPAFFGTHAHAEAGKATPLFSRLLQHCTTSFRGQFTPQPLPPHAHGGRQGQEACHAYRPARTYV